MKLCACVYVIGPEAKLPVKIGFTAGSADSRLRELQPGSPVKLFIYYTLSTEHASTLERLTHQAIDFQDMTRRIHGEWFNVTSEYAKNLIEMLFEDVLNKYILYLKDGGTPRIQWEAIFYEDSEEKISKRSREGELSPSQELCYGFPQEW